MDLALTGKNVVVTGASKGIGKAIALAFAAEGANVAICARSEGPLRATESEIRQTGVYAFAALCDVGQADQLDAFLDERRQHLGSVDVFVSNATGFMFDDTLAAWESCFTVDVMAAVRGCTQVIPWMSAAGGGSILLISSIAGLEAGYKSSYAAAKAALISYSKTLAVALGPQQIRVNVIAPCAITFEGGTWAAAKQQDPDYVQGVIDSIPSGRMGTPAEVAAFGP